VYEVADVKTIIGASVFEGVMEVFSAVKSWKDVAVVASPVLSVVFRTWVNKEVLMAKILPLRQLDSADSREPHRISQVMLPPDGMLTTLAPAQVS
jgi:hypothetical protein